MFLKNWSWFKDKFAEATINLLAAGVLFLISVSILLAATNEYRRAKDKSDIETDLIARHNKTVEREGQLIQEVAQLRSDVGQLQKVIEQLQKVVERRHPAFTSEDFHENRIKMGEVDPKTVDPHDLIVYPSNWSEIVKRTQQSDSPEKARMTYEKTHQEVQTKN